MGLKEIYTSLEEKYYNLMDKMDETGIPVYKAIDFFESKNIPTFPLFVLFILVVLAGIIFFLVPAVTGTQTIDFQLTVTDKTNPVAGASIAYKSGEKNLTTTTDSKGKATLKVQEKEFTVTVTKNGFKKATETFDAKKVKEGKVELEKAVLNPITVQLLGKGNTLLTEEITVSFTCSENSSWNETVTFYTGKTELNDVPADCGKILAQPTEKDCDSSCDFEADSTLIKIYLTEKITKKGKINFSVMDEKGNYLTGIKVMAILKGNYSSEGHCNTFNGLCDVEIPFGTYYIRTTDSTGEFKDYDSKEDTTTVTINSSNQNIDFEEIILKKGVIGEIKIKVKSEQGNPIEDALVKLFKDGTETNQQRTNSSGEAVFNVAEVIDYTASVTHADYLNSESKTVRPKTEFHEFVLKQATPNNTKGIIVSVVDEKGNPVENTKVFLKDIQGNIIGQEKVTGMQGKAVFERLEEGKYVVRAEKIGFEGKDSRVIEVKEKEPQEITITLNIGQGILDVLVVDKEKQPVQSATIKVIDYFTGKEIYVDVTNTEGKKSFTIRADKKVYLEVTESTHAKYTSVPIQMFAGTEEKTISLEGSIASFGVKLEELSMQGMQVENDTLSEGQTYKAKFKLMIPKGTVSNNAGIHIRTGNDEKNQNNTMEKDDLYIKEVIASNAKIIKGTTFNPNSGYSVDVMHLTTGNAKWANVKFSSVREGVYEIEAVIQVRESLNGSAMEIAYRAWVESGGIQRDPYDADLKEAVEISGVKQELYAEAKHKPLGIGASSLCEESFCYSFKVKDLQNATTTNIVDEFPAEISSDYTIEFSFISLNQKTYSNSTLMIEATGIKLNSYEIEGITEEAEEDISVQTGSITEGRKISGKINFTTKSEGTNRIDFSLYGETANFGKEKILFKPVRAEVKNAKTMNIVTSPKNLVPFITNNLLVNITDETGKVVKDADIKIEKNKTFIGTGKTDSKGVFAYTFEPMNAGTTITITAEKSGYNSAEKEMKIQENIVDIIPSSISESFNAKIGGLITRDLVLKNTTEMPLTILSAELTDSFEGKIDSEIQGIGKEIIIANQEQLLITLSLTDNGKNIEELTSLKGEIIIVFENTEAGKQWTSSVPLNITIGLGGEVDSTDCFNLSPTTWSIITGQKKKETKMVLTNSCKVEGEAIALKDVKAKVVWKENAIGSFDLSSGIEDSTTTRLSNNYKTIAGTFNQNTGEEENLTLIFTPDEIANAAGTATIYLEAVNLTEKGEEKLKQKIEVNVNISELTSCIRIRPTTSQLRIQMNYYNQGWGYMPNYFGYNPQNQMPYTMNPSYLNSSGMQFPFQNYPYDPNASAGSLRNNPNVVFPNSVYSQQWPSTYYNAPFTNPTAFNPAINNSWNFNPTGKALIDVENTCPNPVQIEIEAASELAVSDSTIVLTTGNHKEIEVTPSMFIGQYALTIRAKHKDSTDAPKEIAKFNVLVESEAMRNYYDCISLSTRVFTFNKLIQTPVEGSVWNTCYDLGVILTQQSIPRDLSGTSTTNYNFPQDQGVRKPKLESSGVIKSIELIQLVNKPGIDGKITQELKFRMRKNDTYYSLKDNKLPSNENPLIELANLRIRLTGLYYKVEAEERLPITFNDRSGSRQIIPFDIIIEDLFAISEQDLIDFGNKDLSHQECVIGEALIFSGHPLENGTGTDGCFLNDAFVNGVSSGIDAQRVIKKKQDTAKEGKSYCGDTDRIVDITNSTITDESGIVLHFGVENGDKIKMVIDKRNATYTPKEISGTLLARLSRVNPLETKTVSIPFKVCFPEGVKPELTDEEKGCKNKVEEATKNLTREELILIIEQTINRLCPGLDQTGKGKVKEDVVPEPTGEIKACSEGGYTGETAFTEYGFDKIKFDWSWNGITKEECDTGNTYCDAAQLGIELAKKGAEIDALGEILDKLEYKGFKPDRKAKELYRFAVKKTTVIDVTKLSGNEAYFFVDKQDSVIAGEKLFVPEVKTDIDGMNEAIQELTPASAKNIISITDNIIKEIENRKLDTDSIIGEVDVTGMNAENRQTLKDLGKDFANPVEGSSTKYLISFNEFKEFRNKLKACIDANPVAVQCTIEEIVYHPRNTNITLNTVPVTAGFLREMQNNITFKVGIRNIEKISPEDKQKVIKEGQLLLSLPDGKSLKEFYDEKIEFTAFLKYDAFSDDFKGNFQDTYKSNNVSQIEFNNWKFETGKANKEFDSGKHKINFNFDWGNGANTEVTITKTEGLTTGKYKDNYLFSVPFDGSVGVTDKTNRKGYGTGYGAAALKDIYLTENIALKGGNGSNTGLKQFNSTTTPETFASTRAGRILYMKDNNFTFIPSKPLGLKAEIGTGKAGVFYDLIKTGTETIGKDQEKNLTYLFRWNGVSDSKQAESSLKTGTECSDTRFGIIFSSNADKIQKALSFVPVNWAYTFQKQCNAGIDLTGYEFNFDNTGKFTLTPTGLPGTAKFNSGVTGNINQKTSIARWVADIKTENICFNSSSSEFALEWNDEKLMNTIGN